MTKGKKPLLIVAIVVVVILLVLIVTPFFINADTFRPQIEQALSGMLNRPVTIGRLSVSLFRGSLVANRIAIGDDPAYSPQPFLTAQSLAIGVDVMPLLFSRVVNVRSLTIDKPHVQLLRDAQGNWNFDTLGGKTAADPPAPQAAAGPAIQSISIARFAVNDATVAFGHAGQPSRLAYQNANLAARDVSATAPFPITFDARTPGGGKLNLSANVGPIAEANANRLPFRGALKVDKVPSQDVQNLLAVLGYAFPAGSTLQGGDIQANLTLHGPFQRFVTSGPVKLTNVRLQGYSLLGELARALGTSGGNAGGDTVIQIASSDLRYAPEGLRADNLNIVIPALGTLTGSGTVSATNQLNFQMEAKLAGSSPLAQLVNLSFLSQQAGGGLPFHIRGTTSHPDVVPDIHGVVTSALGGLVKSGIGQPAQKSGPVGGLLNELLGKKTKHR